MSTACEPATGAATQKSNTPESFDPIRARKDFPILQQERDGDLYFTSRTHPQSHPIPRRVRTWQPGIGNWRKLHSKQYHRHHI